MRLKLSWGGENQLGFHLMKQIFHFQILRQEFQILGSGGELRSAEGQDATMALFEYRSAARAFVM